MNPRSVHLLGDFYDCEFDFNLPIDKYIEKAIFAVRESKCKYLGHSHYSFSPQGFSIVVLLEESHLSMHTWPEHGYVAVDIYTCGTNADPNAGLEFLRGFFKPKRVVVERVTRGDKLGFQYRTNSDVIYK